MERFLLKLHITVIVLCATALCRAGTDTASAEDRVIHSARAFHCCADGDERSAVVTGVAITPDGSTIAAATDDHQTWIWNAATAELQARLTGHADWVHCVGLSCDGRTLVSGAGDRSICLWDIAERRQISHMRACSNAIAAAAFHPNNQQVAVVGFSNQLHIVNTSTGQCAEQLECPCADVRTVAFAPDGSRMAVAGRCGTLRVWNLDSGMTARDIATDGRRIRTLAFSPDARLLAAAGNSAAIHVFDVANGQQLMTLDARPAKTHALLFLGVDHLASGGTDNRVRIWDLASRAVTTQLAGHTGTVAALACDASGQQLVSGSYDTTVRLWDLRKKDVSATASRQPPGASR